MQKFAANNTLWLHREVGVGQHALDDAEHQAELEKLMGVLCENYDAFGNVPTVDPTEVSSPGR